MKVESQLTIFYGGQVMVFDDFTAEKAKQVIDLANKGSDCTQNIAKNQKEIASSTPNPVHSPAKTAAASELVQTNTFSLACGIYIFSGLFDAVSRLLAFSYISLTFFSVFFLKIYL